MEDVTDNIFREVIAITAKPDIMFTEFTNVHALMSEGREDALINLEFSGKQRPIVAQIWGVNPDFFKESARLIVKLGFDGIDINMGCPVKKVTSMGSGAAHIKDKMLSAEIIKATKEGAGDIPVSVKTRIGFDKVETEDWASFLLEQGIAALTIHGRTAKQMSKVSADWNEIGKVVKLRDEIAPSTIVIGNGDVLSYQEVIEKSKRYGVDGVMIGRGIFQNPWVFEKEKRFHSKEERIKLLILHIKLFEKRWKGKLPDYRYKGKFQVLKKFFKIYIRDFNGASDLRQRLMECNFPEEVYKIDEIKSINIS